MGKSLEARFNGKTAEAVKNAQDRGIMPTFQEYRRQELVNDLGCFMDFLHKSAPGVQFQMVKKDNSGLLTDYESTKTIWLVMLETIFNLKAANMAKDARITELEKRVDYFKAMHRNESSDIMQAILRECKA